MTTDWKQIPTSHHPGERGTAAWQTTGVPEDTFYLALRANFSLSLKTDGILLYARG